jgi:hypothetical protein
MVEKAGLEFGGLMISGTMYRTLILKFDMPLGYY